MVGALLYRLAIRPAGKASLTTLVIITIGAATLIRGVVQIALGKQELVFPGFSGEGSVRLFGASIANQSFWILGTLAVVFVALKWFFERSLFGKAMRATAQNPLAASLVGIEVNQVLMASFALSGALGALAGALTTPLTLTRYDIGIMLGLKGFAAGMLGGLANPFGAVGGGLLLGLAEVLAGAYVSSGYQDAVAFAIILGVLFTRPTGLFGRAAAERV